MILRIHIPGNPWDGAINRRDRAAVSSRGKVYNRKLSGFQGYQDLVALWAASARNAQRWPTLTGTAEVWITLWVPDRKRRDVDGPIKAILDGLTAGRVWADDSLVWDQHARKRLGPPGADVLVRATEVLGVVPGQGSGGGSPRTRRRSA